jgi:ubiquinone/menaquinone biosynthesis C-methylase UbiE
VGRFAKSRLAARLQMQVSKRRLESGLYDEIAFLLPLKKKFKVLDIGTGTGLQLKAIAALDPTVQLFGIDLSEEAIKLAKKQLEGMKADLRQGDITQTDYDDDFFDITTCNASMSYWENPIVCFDEIYRILKPGGCAVLTEPHADIDIDRALEIIKENMAEKNPLRRWLAVSLNRYGLQSGNRVGMKLYKIEELEALIEQSKFKGHGLVKKISLQRIPIFAKITLNKPKQIDSS